MAYPKIRQSNIVMQELENEILLYDLETNKAFCLNETSAMIYQFCDGKNSVAEISNQLGQNLNQFVAEDLVWLALDGFRKDNLLEESEQFAINFVGLNRRQMIKKVGLATMILLPVVSSIVAPMPVMAGSCLPNGTPVGNPFFITLGVPLTCSSITASLDGNGRCDNFFGDQCCSNFAATNGCTQTAPNQATVTCGCS